VGRCDIEAAARLRRSFGRREATMKLSQDCWRVPRFAAAAAQLGEPAGLDRVIDAGSIISGIELGSGRAAIRKAIEEVAADPPRGDRGRA